MVWSFRWAQFSDNLSGTLCLNVYLIVSPLIQSRACEISCQLLALLVKYPGTPIISGLTAEISYTLMLKWVFKPATCCTLKWRCCTGLRFGQNNVLSLKNHDPNFERKVELLLNRNVKQNCKRGKISVYYRNSV